MMFSCLGAFWVGAGIAAVLDAKHATRNAVVVALSVAHDLARNLALMQIDATYIGTSLQIHSGDDARKKLLIPAVRSATTRPNVDERPS